LGEDVKAAQPHGKKGDHYLYFAVRPLMDEICNALREVGFTEMDNMLADMFVQWVYKVKPNDDLPRYWKISPGGRAKYWNEFKELGCIAIGWSETGNLRRFNSQEEIKDFITRDGWEGNLSYTSEQLWWLSHEMQEGDKVFAYGGKKILGLGEILGGYDFRQDDVMHFAHRRPVKWNYLESKPIGNLPDDLQKKLSGYPTIVRLSEHEGQQVMALYESGISPPPELEGPQVKPSLSRYFAAHGLHFAPEQLATFYTALKTKGFVILTGISGTGKTKLAQYFAELFPAPERTVTEEPDDAEAVIRLQIQPYMLKYTRLIVPKGYWKLLDVPAAGETVEVELTFDGKSETCRLTHASYGAADYLQILFRGKARKWLTANFHEDDIILLEPAFSDEGDFIGFYLRKPETRQVRKREPNFYFASVRPDWKDSKSLLGYYNPLSEQFESTNFLRFILKAHQDLAVPYFILLDEMNLAKVEYYFADFLSVLESGRREDGFTKEAIRFQYPEDIDGPPRALHLSPNLYFIGTVNVDETTYMFSPKVLDRAFTLELATVNLQDYPGEQGEPLSDEVLEQLRAQLLPDFTRQGQFAVVDKTRVAEFAATHDIYRQHLSTLNVLLRSHDLHFGYRVFDEIMMFLANAEGSPVFDGFGPDGLDAAFDAAVLMKVLPKFHGTRGKLREPLEKMVWWAREPDNPEAGRQALSDKLQNTEGIASLKEDLRERIEGGTTEESSDANAFAYPRTALKALRMLHDLHTTGFASFA